MGGALKGAQVIENLPTIGIAETVHDLPAPQVPSDEPPSLELPSLPGSQKVLSEDDIVGVRAAVLYELVTFLILPVDRCTGVLRTGLVCDSLAPFPTNITIRGTAMSVEWALWIGVLHHVCNNHTWETGSCQHDHLEDTQGKQWIERDSKSHKALVDIVLNKRWQKDVHKYLRFRSTAHLESFQNHILMYASKRQAFNPRAYDSRVVLAALDYNFHRERPTYRTAEGQQVLRKKYNKNARRYSLYAVKCEKSYGYIPELQARILKGRVTSGVGMLRRRTLHPDDPRRLGVVPPIPPPPTSELITLIQAVLCEMWKEAHTVGRVLSTAFPLSVRRHVSAVVTGTPSCSCGPGIFPVIGRSSAYISSNHLPPSVCWRILEFCSSSSDFLHVRFLHFYIFGFLYSFNSAINMKMSVFARVLLISAVVISVDGETPADKFKRQHINKDMDPKRCDTGEKNPSKQ
ncbi:hypothetical protein PFLUV_G00092440 [Perca fluviatilis]|uniref:Uncharacterized protein n=1 Tax=Perca fluviatilis TaxID=8168 RepID=A0A6A5FFI0_PERFL|nr:hypothetical protein PFLUV_G00092440 [Perca fluviatilis]